MSTKRTILYVTGSRAEFGLMSSTLRAIACHRGLRLQLAVTGMHLDRRLGYSLDQIRAQGWKVDAVVPWKVTATKAALAQATGAAVAGLARAYSQLQPDLVLVCGDRVEAFAAASAAHLAGIPLAHVHGGDRALGQVDDALRHAITKLAHLHLPATQASADRILRLGEDPWRVHVVGSPGNDAIASGKAPWSALRQQFPFLQQGTYAVIAYHPAIADESLEQHRAAALLKAVQQRFPQVVIIGPNNDPGCRGILRCWNAATARAHANAGGHDTTLVSNLSRPLYLSLLAHAALLVGNSSSGLIEAPALGTSVVDVGDRQKGRERPTSVIHATLTTRSIAAALEQALHAAPAGHNPYGGSGAGRRIASVLARVPLGDRLLTKLIAY